MRCLSGSPIKSSLVVDSGASVCISPHKEDFVDYGASNMKIKDLSSSNTVAGEGIISWSLQDINGSTVVVEVKGYHIPHVDIRLLSPQVLLSTIGGSSLQTTSGVELTLNNGVALFAPHCPHSNLPLLPLANTSHHVRCFWSCAFGFTSRESTAINGIKTSLLNASNTNLSLPQKEVLLWHHHLSHASIPWVQSLMRHRKFLPCSNDDNHALHQGPFIRTNSRAPACDISGLKCAACLYAKASVRSPSNLPPRRSPRNMTLKTNDLQPGSCVSADHYFSPIQGRLPHSFGWERIGYSCGSLFVDHASGKIFNFPQYSNTADETIKSAMKLEALARDEGFKIKEYHSDNGIFSSAEFKAHCDRHQTKYSFSGVGAKHMNGVAERNIKTVAQWARANMLHLAHSWPQHADPKYWPQAINYATWVFNHLPNRDSGISPNKLWSGVRTQDNVFRQAHVFGCPVYVLDAALQDGKKIPKWSPRARLGLFLDFSDVHSSQVPLVLNVETKKISPQFHVIFDDTFTTVHSLPSNKPIDEQWKEILKFDRDCFAEVDYDNDGEPILPPLSDIIKTYQDEREQRLDHQLALPAPSNACI
jgi:hypothetical protein